jgi:hypothetical protein
MRGGVNAIEITVIARETKRLAIFSAGDEMEESTPSVTVF